MLTIVIALFTMSSLTQSNSHVTLLKKGKKKKELYKRINSTHRAKKFGMKSAELHDSNHTRSCKCWTNYGIKGNRNSRFLMKEERISIRCLGLRLECLQHLLLLYF